MDNPTDIAFSPAVRAAFFGSLSDTAMKRTPACFAASRARSVPMRPAPMMPRPIGFINRPLSRRP